MRRQSFFLTAMAMLAACTCTNMAFGVTDTNAIATGNWVNVATWDNGVPPETYDAQINDNYTVSIAPGDDAVAFRVILGDNTAATTGTINMTGGTLSTDKMLSLGGFEASGGSNGTAVLNQSGGNIYVGGIVPGPHWEQLVVGHNGTSHGIYNLSGGTVDAPEGLSIAHSATSSGEMHQTGGAVTVGDLDEPAQGYFNVGNSGVGTYTLDAGSVTMTTAPFYMGYAATGNGAVTQSGGTIDAINLLVGRLGVGNYDMSGGSIKVAENVWVASRAAAVGTYSLAADATAMIVGDLNICAAVDDGGGTPSGTTGTLNLIGEDVTLSVGGSLLANGVGVDATNNSAINFTTGATGNVSTIAVAGNADVDGAVIDIIESDPLPLGTVLNLVETYGGITNAGTASVGPTAAGSWVLQLGGTSNEVLQAVKVPEPSCAILAMIGAIVACLFRKR